MDIRRRCWHREAIAAIDPGLEAKLPPLRHPAEPIGYIKRGIASGFGMEKVFVSSGGRDNMMAAIGTGNVVPGVCTLSLGTSGTVYSYFNEPFIDPEGEIAAFGAALQSIWSYERERGGKTDIASIVERRVKRGKVTIEPQKKNFSLYDDLQERFNSLWKTLANEFEAHRTLT